MMRKIKKLLNAPNLFVDWVNTAGWSAAATFIVHRAKSTLGFESATVEIKPRQARHSVLARTGGSSDLEVFHLIFRLEEYACIRDISPVRVILDLGANVGYSSAYLLSCYPDAKVVAVEPDPGNFEICKQNLAPYGDRAKVVRGAVWSKPCKLVLSQGTFGDGREWATQVYESTGEGAQAAVEAWDVPSLLSMAGGESIDLLKIDIEGSELDLFSANTASWLPKVRNLCIEIHGDECKDAVMNALKNFDYDLSTSGELTICRNMKHKLVAARAGT